MSSCRLSMNSSSLFRTMLESKGERMLPWGVPILDLSSFPFSSVCPTFRPLSIRVRVLAQETFFFNQAKYHFVGDSIEAFGNVPVYYSGHMTPSHVDFLQSVDK